MTQPETDGGQAAHRGPTDNSGAVIVCHHGDGESGRVEIEVDRFEHHVYLETFDTTVRTDESPIQALVIMSPDEARTIGQALVAAADLADQS